MTYIVLDTLLNKNTSASGHQIIDLLLMDVVADDLFALRVVFVMGCFFIYIYKNVGPDPREKEITPPRKPWN